MATTSPQLAIPLPVSTDTDQVPTDLMTAFSYAEKYFVGRYASAAARGAAIPSPVAGMTSYVTADGYPTWYDGTIWRPFSGQLVGTFTGTPVAGSGGGAVDACFGPSIPNYTFPVSMRADWGITISWPTAADVQSMYLQLDNVPTMITRYTGGYAAGTGSREFYFAAGSGAHAFKTTYAKVVGSSVAGSYADPLYSWLYIVVRAQ